MQVGNVLRVRTLSTSQFTGALTKGGGAAVVDLDVGAQTGNGNAGQGLAAGKHMRCRVREIRILSAQNLAWGVELWGSATGIAGAAIDDEVFLGRWAFTAADGKRDTGETFYKYWIAGLDLAYEDFDKAGKFHIRLINLDAGTDKLANAAGAIVLEFAVEPTTGW